MGAVVLVVFIIVAATATTQSDYRQASGLQAAPIRATAAPTPATVSLADEFGCQWIMDEYRPMATLGHDVATLHVSNAMTLKRQEAGNVFGIVGSGDAAAAIRDCEARGFK